jgi:hypothetical protein
MAWFQPSQRLRRWSPVHVDRYQAFTGHQSEGARGQRAKLPGLSGWLYLAGIPGAAAHRHAAQAPHGGHLQPEVGWGADKRKRERPAPVAGRTLMGRLQAGTTDGAGGLTRVVEIAGQAASKAWAAPGLERSRTARIVRSLHDCGRVPHGAAMATPGLERSHTARIVRSLHDCGRVPHGAAMATPGVERSHTARIVRSLHDCGRVPHGAAMATPGLERSHTAHSVYGWPACRVCRCRNRCDVDRLAFSVIWEVDAEANVLSTRFTKSIIRSRASLTYAQVGPGGGLTCQAAMVLWCDCRSIHQQEGDEPQTWQASSCATERHRWAPVADGLVARVRVRVKVVTTRSHPCPLTRGRRATPWPRRPRHFIEVDRLDSLAVCARCCRPLRPRRRRRASTTPP